MAEDQQDIRRTKTNILGVDYVHLEIAGKGDLYVTDFGVRYIDNLMPRNWREEAWFNEKREPLEGTSTIYRLPTKEVNGRSIDLVVKWCRVGSEVPIDTMTLHQFSQVEFNSPYEEFSLVMEMRKEGGGAIRTHRPLAIYVPAKRFELWQTGRKEYMMDRKRARYRDVELDIYRHYILIYEWVGGVSAVEAMQFSRLPEVKRLDRMAQLTLHATDELKAKGYRVLDMKPNHVIVRPQPDGSMLTRRGKVAYALVDFELLQRTPEHEKAVAATRRADYHVRQRDRFAGAEAAPLPPHLQRVSIMGVDYVYGHTESTQGVLWVVGRDPDLFDYFQPERWRRTPRTKVSETNEVYRTLAKDHINLVWKVSRVGEPPDVGPLTPTTDEAKTFGYNSPFEEFSIALEVSRKGLSAVYPRAIYMTGLEARDTEYASDESRYKSHEGLTTPEGRPILRHDHNYISVWGYWNGLDELLASHDGDFCTAINARKALQEGLINEREYSDLLEHMNEELRNLGFENLGAKGSHYLLSQASDGNLIRDEHGRPTVRMCNFGLVRRIE